MKINPKVIDISHYDDVEVVNGVYVGFKKVYAAGYRGVINKCTQGTGYVDPTYASRRTPCRSYGLLWGGYHFLDTSRVRNQVDNFLIHAAIDDHTLVALDHETSAVPLEAAWQFMELVKGKIGRYPYLYSGHLIKEQLGSTKSPYWAQTKLWLAHYSSTPTWPPTWKSPTLWQFTGDGVGPMPHTVPGVTIAGGCDINSFDGTDEQLKKVWAT